MKKIGIILCCLFLVGCSNKTQTPQKEETPKQEEKPVVVEKSDYVSYNGKLKVSGTSIVNEKGEKIRLRGVSSHGLQWFSDLITEENIEILKNEWHTNVFRLAMYTDEGGYIQNKDIRKMVEEKIELLIKKDMYIILDWHILKDNNPNTYKTEAKEFFDYMSQKYKDTPNILFEICNEPNGNVHWSSDIKPYADEIILVIRKNSDAIVIVGTATWSQDIVDPVANRIDDTNTMYALHFYAGTHKDYLREKVLIAKLNNLPIFVSEWGTSSADGNGGVFIEESNKWVEFMDTNNLSWVNWSLTNKNETSALLKENTTVLKDENLSESGKYIKSILTKED